jgi:hypothetical protein
MLGEESQSTKSLHTKGPRRGWMQCTLYTAIIGLDSPSKIACNVRNDVTYLLDQVVGAGSSSGLCKIDRVQPWS